MGRTLVEEDDLMIEGCLTTRKNPVDRTKSSSKGQGISRDRSSVRSRKTSRENPGRRARTPVDRTKSSSKGPGVIRRRPSVPFRKRNPKRPHVVVYNNSVSVDMLLENKTDRPFVQRVYRNLRIEGSVSNTVHANLRKIEAYACTPADTAESSFTDLVISRDGSSVRFGELDHVTIKGRRPACQGRYAMSEIAENTLGLVRAFMRRQFPGFDYDREYKMLKPKVLFHTWVAIYGSGIFDGTFALPKLDYVTKIKSNARFLEKQRIPLMIVYS
ncbi:hypothetical protein Q5P01_000727 [Channa striata]|uniref:Uncharacterized protein n=1 Tax=Channa striata TaxID=64152 RepID=A0AA88II10_CHASR|nr:hypothetical protein Q5P01_000727 [Channa striata]